MSGRSPERSRRSRTPARSRSAIAKARCRSPISIAGNNRSGIRSTFVGRLWNTCPPNSMAWRFNITFVPVTPANRLQKVASGEIDLECGSTTGNVQRRKEVAFSPIFFVAGTKLMVPKSSSIRSYRDLAGKTAVVTSGTTNEAALRGQAEARHHNHYRPRSRAISRDARIRQGGRVCNRRRAFVRVHCDGEECERHESRRRVSVLRSLWPSLSARRSGFTPLWSLVLSPEWQASDGSPSETLNLPMSPQLEEVFRMLGQPE